MIPVNIDMVGIAYVKALLDSFTNDEPDAQGDKSMTNKLTEYVKTAEAAGILGVAQNTLRKWAMQGNIPFRRNPANGYRLFKRADLEKFLKKAATPVKVTR